MMKGKVTRRGLLLGGASALVGLGLPAVAAESEMAKGLDHERYMRLAIEQGKKNPKYPFGAVIVNMRTKEVVAEGFNHAYTNPIWHGEMTVINKCPDMDTGFNWKEMCIYTTGEPCAMCQSAILWTGMPLVVYGSSIPFLNTQKSKGINIRATAINNASFMGKCEIIGGVLEKECNELFAKAASM